MLTFQTALNYICRFFLQAPQQVLKFFSLTVSYLLVKISCNTVIALLQIVPFLSTEVALE